MSDETNAVTATDVTVVLDRSGSMAAITHEVIAGFNGFLSDQAASAGKCRLTLVQFDSEDPFEVVIDDLPVAECVGLTTATYEPRGGTPLYDALGNALVYAEKRLAAADGEVDPLVVVITDGLENSSSDYTREQVFERITELRDRGWTFAFLAANQDAMSAGGAIGLAGGSTANWDASAEGIDLAFSLVADRVTEFRGRSREDRLAARDDFFEEGEA
ncbi:MAG: VWA domain-containing protein [Acidimicrobiales bacterium]